MQPTPEQIQRARVIVNSVAISTEDVITDIASIIAERDDLRRRVNNYEVPTNTRGEIGEPS